MLSLRVDLPAGRYHATPWDRQVNEGEVEWPPSPWRLLRTLISCYYMKASELDAAVVKGTLAKLVSPPSYYLPNATMSHTRHYMPPFKGNTTKIFDAFLRIRDGDSVIITWHDVNLTGDECKILDVLLDKVGYLGRAESWAILSRIENAPTANCVPFADSEIVPNEMEIVKCLAPMIPSEYAAWREKTIRENTERRLTELKRNATDKGKPSEKVKLAKKDAESIESSIPADIFEAMKTETADLKKAGWSQPPGSIWIKYLRHSNCFEPPIRAKCSQRTESLPTVARYAVSSNALPRLTDAISLAERIHSALVKYSDGSTEFTGCDDSGKPLEGNKHSFILCESNKALGRGNQGDITHVTVFCPLGFSPRERQALDQLTRVWGYGGHDVLLTLIGVGKSDELGGLNILKGESPILAKSRMWISRTPFIPTRHPKYTRAGKPKLDENGAIIGSPEHDLARLLECNNFSRPIKIERIGGTDLAGHETKWLDFRRERKNGDGIKATNLGFGFKIEFSKSVQGPISVGYGAHFALGLFVPDKDSADTQNPK